MFTSKFRIASLLVTIITLNLSNTEKCHSVTKDDAMTAAYASHSIYKFKFKRGDKVPGTPFTVQKVVKPLLYSVPLEAIVATHNDTTLICVKGTRTVAQLLQEFRAILHPTKKLYYGHKHVHVLSYFWYAMISFNPNKLVSNPNNQTRYIFTGHSLGGAVASLLALNMKVFHPQVWQHPDSSLITFGEPRVGDKEYAKLHDLLIPTTRKIRFVYEKDIVPHIPPKPFFYHHSREVWIWKKLRHFWRWKWDRFWTACPLGDLASSCSNNIAIKTTFSHSMTNYLNSIVSEPKGYYDRFNIDHNSFDEALCT